MTGGSRKKDSGNLLAGERRIKECEEGIAKKRAAVEKIRAALEGCGKELELARAAYEKFRLEVQEQAASFAALSQQENTLSALVAEAENDASA